MLKNKLFVAAAGLALLALGSCGTNNVGGNSPQIPGHTSSAFQVDVQDSTYALGGSTANVYTTIDNSPQMDKDHVVVNINVDGAAGLKSLYLTLKYDPSQYRAQVVQPTKLMGDGASLLSMYAPTTPGTLEYGQVLVNPDYQVGLNGGGIVAQVSFLKQPEYVFRKVSVAGPPAAPSSKITDLAFDGTNLTWTYTQLGDYDQNGETNPSDLTPIAQHFKEASPGGVGTPWPKTAVQSIIDGDSNGEINPSDITPIAQNFKCSTLGGLHVYRSASAGDYPATPSAPNGAGATEATAAAGLMPTDAANYANRSTERLVYSFPVPSPVANESYWVRGKDTAGALGIASNEVGGDPTALPALSMDTVATPPVSGTGTQVDPYLLTNGNSYNFKLLDTPGGADVTTDPNTVFIVTPTGAGTWAGNILTVDGTFNGDYTITATYNGVANHSSSNVYATSGVPAQTVAIMKDPADNDWATVTGTGADDPNAYVLHTSTFNPDADSNGAYDLTFSLAATKGGNAAPNADLDWAGFPPFLPFDPAAFTADATAGTFQVWQFSDGYLFAQDPAQPGAQGKSNSLYVAVNSLSN
jgi:hypothetical protein